MTDQVASTRRSGVIAFTDIVGFTQLTDLQGDDAALEVLERQDAVVRACLDQRGVVVKELGDGMLLWFDDAADAVRVGLDLQHGFEHSEDERDPLWVRIGMHFGCPRWRGQDIIGRDVNLASRIADLAGPGEVLVSRPVVRAAGPVDGIAYESLGPVFVRGISDPVPLLRAYAA
jgi:adenylate cyclase